MFLTPIIPSYILKQCNSSCVPRYFEQSMASPFFSRIGVFLLCLNSSEMTSLVRQLFSMSTRIPMPKSPRARKDSIGMPSGPTAVLFQSLQLLVDFSDGYFVDRTFDWRVLSELIMIFALVEQFLEVFFPSIDNLVLLEQWDCFRVFHKESLLTVFFDSSLALAQRYTCFCPSGLLSLFLPDSETTLISARMWASRDFYFPESEISIPSDVLVLWGAAIWLFSSHLFASFPLAKRPFRHK